MLACPRYELHFHFITLFSGIFGLRKTVDFLKDYHTKVRMSDNLPERVQILGHTHIICITLRENRIICCQIFCDLLLKSAFERILNVLKLILNDMHVTQDLNSFGEIITHVQLMKKMSDARKNIFCVYHIRIIAPKKNGLHDMKQTDSSI
jgi:hypothetical protein